MSAVWFDRAGVALIVAAASAYLLRRLARRASVAFGRGAAGSDPCATECGCDQRRQD